MSDLDVNAYLPLSGKDDLSFQDLHQKEVLEAGEFDGRKIELTSEDRKIQELCELQKSPLEIFADGDLEKKLELYRNDEGRESIVIVDPDAHNGVNGRYLAFCDRDNCIKKKHPCGAFSPSMVGYGSAPPADMNPPSPPSNPEGGEGEQKPTERKCPGPPHCQGMAKGHDSQYVVFNDKVSADCYDLRDKAPPPPEPEGEMGMEA